MGGSTRFPHRTSPGGHDLPESSQYGYSSHPPGRVRAVGEPLSWNFSVELRGFEPLTPSMPWRCATSCATAPRSGSSGLGGPEQHTGCNYLFASASLILESRPRRLHRHHCPGQADARPNLQTQGLAVRPKILHEACEVSGDARARGCPTRRHGARRGAPSRSCCWPGAVPARPSRP